MHCENKCGEKVLFSLGDQQANKCKYFEPRGRETYKLNKVDWICSSGHTVKGVAEGKAKPCKECCQSFDDKLYHFLTRRLRECARDIEEGFDKIHRKNREEAPPAVKYTVFLHALFAFHGIKGQGLMHLEACSAKRKCLVQCSLPTLELKNSFPEFNSKDSHEHKVFRMMKYLMNSELISFTSGVFKREFGLKNLQQYLWCELVLKV